MSLKTLGIALDWEPIFSNVLKSRITRVFKRKQRDPCNWAKVGENDRMTETETGRMLGHSGQK